MNKKVNLAQFGVTEIGYKDLKTAMRYFGKPFNEFFGIVEDNQTATVEEIIVYALNVASKGARKGNKVTEYLDKVKAEKGLVVKSEEDEEVDVLQAKIEQIKERQAKELLGIVAVEVFGLESAELDSTIPRGVEVVDLDTVSPTDITKTKEVKPKATTPKTVKAKATEKEGITKTTKEDVLAKFEKEMAEKNGK
jgi:hypothetical protein